jgi:hypothetical protein
VLENFAHVVQAVLRARRWAVVTSVGELLPFPRGMVVDLVLLRAAQVPAWRMRGAFRSSTC